jgi:hypothetical protein
MLGRRFNHLEGNMMDEENESGEDGPFYWEEEYYDDEEWDVE